jgi:hypothetical protein
MASRQSLIEGFLIPLLGYFYVFVQSPLGFSFIFCRAFIILEEEH